MLGLHQTVIQPPSNRWGPQLISATRNWRKLRHQQRAQDPSAHASSITQWLTHSEQLSLAQSAWQKSQSQKVSHFTSVVTVYKPVLVHFFPPRVTNTSISMWSHFEITHAKSETEELAPLSSLLLFYPQPYINSLVLNCKFILKNESMQRRKKKGKNKITKTTQPDVWKYKSSHCSF